ncbi:MAG: TlpA disulfide reductase family protein [Gammaproteobacteria bacterium]|jgi:thiol-disulfide isomerase/thioredoxin
MRYRCRALRGTVNRKPAVSLGPRLAGTALLACLLVLFSGRGATLAGSADSAPADFSLTDLRGKTTRLADHRGRVVLVNFWATWCPPCIREMPSLERLQQRLADRPFTLLTVNVGEGKSRVWKFLQRLDFHLPVLLDPHSRTFDAWGSDILPTTFLLDRSGRIRYRAQGDREWDSDAVVTLIDRLLNEASGT